MFENRTLWHFVKNYYGRFGVLVRSEANASTASCRFPSSFTGFLLRPSHRLCLTLATKKGGLGALLKLRQLDASSTLDDLRNPPGNRLEALQGGRVGQMSIRINGQWRICFQYSNGVATDVEIFDCH
jgi:plasmid maintenance system killer protein